MRAHSLTGRHQVRITCSDHPQRACRFRYVSHVQWRSPRLAWKPPTICSRRPLGLRIVTLRQVGASRGTNSGGSKVELGRVVPSCYARCSPRAWTKVAVVAGMLFASLLVAVTARAETPSTIIAAHIRTQGYPCKQPIVATRNRQASKPNETVWALRCANATYRVRLVPDLAAHVTRLR